MNDTTDTVAITVNIPTQRIADIIDNAPEAIAYWGSFETYQIDGVWAGEAVMAGKELKIIETDWGNDNGSDESELTEHTLTREKVLDALTLMANHSQVTFVDIMTEDDYVGTSDSLIQLALFGEVKYG